MFTLCLPVHEHSVTVRRLLNAIQYNNYCHSLALQLHVH